MNFISKAHAAATTSGAVSAGTTSATEAFLLNILLIVILVVLFYFLLIKPQQKRIKKHREMIDNLKKGEDVVTSGGLIGKIHKINKDNDEVVIDLGNNMKVTALRSTLQLRRNPGVKE